MKRFNKVLLIILISLAVLVGLAYLTLYIINKELAQSILNSVIDFVNRPLPIVGMTSVALLVFIWKVVVFVRKTQPSKELSALMQEHEEYKRDSEKDKAELRQENSQLKGYIVHICELSTNQKIKNFGKELLGYGKETNDNEPKEEEM